jgi:hypothetical protein
MQTKLFIILFYNVCILILFDAKHHNFQCESQYVMIYDIIQYEILFNNKYFSF